MTTYIETAVKAFRNPDAWNSVAVPVPHSPVIWGSLGLPFALLLLTFIGWKIWRAGQQIPHTVTVVDLPDADWNLVQIGVNAARHAISDTAQIGSRYTVALTSGWRSAPARLEVRKIGDEVRVSSRMFKRLNLREPSEPEQSAMWKQKIGIHIPYFRPDLWTFWHPDPNIRLQWRLGALFMVLGIVIPHMLSHYFDI